MNEIKTTYRDVEIKYGEIRNVWVAEGYREKSSLSDMKQAIDRQLDKDPDKKKKEPIEVILLSYSCGSCGIRKPTFGKTTGVNEDGGAWFTSSAGKREKVSKYDIKNLFVASVENKSILNQCQQIDIEIKSLSDKLKFLIEQLTPANIQ